MAVDSPVVYNGAWVYLRDHLGPNYGGANDRQKQNATLIYNQLRVFGYSHVAACGILGNMQTESSLSPGALSGQTSALPNDGEHLTDLTNNVILNWTGSGAHAIGLIQWDGTTSQTPAGSQIGSFAVRYDLQWYDWELQVFRLEMEYTYDPSGWGGVNGTTYNFWYPVSGTADISWKNYKSYTGDVGTACDYFRMYRERSSGDPTGNQHRRENAQYWSDYFANYSVTVQVSNVMHACMAYLFRDSRYGYDQWVNGIKQDCIGFCNLVRKRLGLPLMTNGTNSLWRNVGGNFLWWRGTRQECIDLYGEIPVGAYLFKCYPEGDPGYNPPAQYRGDGVGDFNHIGIYTNRGLGVMQSGGYDTKPPYGNTTGVHDTNLEPLQPVRTRPWWNYVAFGDNIVFEHVPVPPITTIPPAYFTTLFKRKKGIINVKRICSN